MKKQFYLKSLLSLLLLFVGINAWGADETATLTNANIVAATGSASTSYASYAITDGNSNTWNVYAIKNYHSKATNSNYFLQIKKYASSTAYYIQVPTLGTKIKTITLTVSSSSSAMGSGGNSATLYFSSSNSTSAAGTGVVSGTGASSVTIDASSLNVNTGYITASGAVRIWDVTVTYETSGSETETASAPTLTASGVFTTSSKDVTITNNESGATVYYTTDGTDPTTSSSSFTGESTKITINATTTVKAMAVVSDKDNSSIASATYTHEDPIANTAETAYTTAEAIALIDAGSTQLTSTEVYVKGTISKVDSYNSTYGSITYWLDSDAFEIYGGLNTDGGKFTAATDLQAGDEVVVKGLITKFGTTYEMNKNNVLISRKTTATQTTPTFTLGTYKTSMAVGDADDEYTVTTNSDGAVTVTSSDENVAKAIYESGTVLVSAKAAGTTTITVKAAATATYYEASKSYTLTVSEPVQPASLPFSFDGGVADVATTQGMSQTGLGSDYSSSPKLKFNDTGDALIINYNADGGKLVYTIKGYKGTTNCSGQFDVMESANGTDYTTIKSYSTVETTSTVETLTLTKVSRYVKFVYTNKSDGNVALGAISIKAAGAKEDPKLAFEKTSYTFATTATSMAVKATSAAGSTGAVTYALTEGNSEKFLIDESTGDIVCVTAGTYTVTATIAADDNYETATATATVTIEAPTTSSIALVAKYGDKYYAMDHDFNAVEVTISDGKAVVIEPLASSITWSMTTSGTTTTFQTSESKYLSAPSKTTLSLVDDAFNWTYDTENKTWSATVGSTERSFLYREQAGAFKAYATSGAGTDDYSAMAHAYEIETTEGFALTISAASYATFYNSEKAYTIPTGLTGYIFNKDTKKIVSTYTESSTVPAGEALVLGGEAGTYSLVYTSTSETKSANNALLGTDEETALTADANYYFYGLSLNSAGETSSVGFYWMAAEGAAFTNGAHKAYLKLAKGSGAKSGYAFNEGDVDAINAVETSVDMNAPVYNLAGQRVAPTTKGILIQNGKKFINK